MASFIKRVKEKVSDKFLLKTKTKIINETTYIYNYEDSEKKKILLYFPLSEYMHLGDHLFFEPLAKNLKNRGYDVSISPSKSMEFYFRELQYKIYNGEDLGNFDVIVSRTEFFKTLINQKNVILYEYINTSLKEKICLDIVKKIFLILGESCVNIDSEPSNLDIKNNNFQLSQNKKYILFNNYLDSGRWLNGKEYFYSIEKKAIELKNAGYSLIHLGTEKDFKDDKNQYPYIELDLRGKTSVKDLFYLSSAKNVVGNIGFDAFLMHLFFLNRKKNYICLRNKITQKRKEITIKYLNPPFKICNEEKIEYINKN
ncbi:MAG: hypothetical protein ACRC6A_11365 [Fusobacteriaceae bacterium]